MTATQTYLMYIVVLLLFDLLLRLSRRKPDKTKHFIQRHKGHSGNAKQKTVRNTEEQSWHTKASIVWPIKMKTSQEIISAGIKDISIESAFIVCPNPLPVKEQLRIAIAIPNQEPIVLPAEVVWSNSNVPEDKVLSRGMGIKFLQSTEKVRESLNNAIHIYQTSSI